MIGLSREELDQFVRKHVQSWFEETSERLPGEDLTSTHAHIEVALSHAVCLIVANNQRIEEDLRRLGLLG